MARKKARGDRVGELLAEFERVVPDAKGKSWRKVEIVMYDLYDADDERVLPLFLRVLADEKEYDLVRIEVLKVLPLWDHEGNVPAAAREEVGRLLTRVMLHDPDTLVRNYAAQAAYAFVDVPGVFPAAVKLLLDPDEDIDIRHAALYAVQVTGPTKEARDVLSHLRGDAEMGDHAERILQDWAAKGKG
jgi:hypothetical protein